jgi:hypothetical protein
MARQGSERLKKEPKVWPQLANDADACGVPLPAIVIRVVRVPQSVGGTEAGAPPLLYPHRPAKNWVGRDTMAGVTKSIMNLLSVYSIVAFRLMQAEGMTRLDAVMAIESAAGQSFTPIQKVAQKQLSNLTAFDGDNEVIAWAGNPTSLFRIPVRANEKALRQASFGVVDLLRVALAKTRRVLRAVQATQLSPSDEVGAAFAEAFDAGVRLDASDCYRFAIFGDINPAPLWREPARYARIYELARFIGRVDRGAKAVLTGHHQEIMREALESVDASEDLALAAMYDEVRSSIELHFGVARFQEILGKAREANGIGVVDRRSRRLRCRTDIGMQTRATGWR